MERLLFNKLPMKKTVFVLLILFSLRVSAQFYKSEDGVISFFSKAPLKNIEATSKHLVSLINNLTGEIVFSVSIQSFEFENKKMQEDFNEDFMDSDKFPVAGYKGKIHEIINWKKEGKYKVISTGVLTIHGVENTRTDTAEIKIEQGKLNLQGNFLVRVA